MTNHLESSSWWLRGHFYSLYIDKFAGDIPGLIDRLDYFTKLGIDCLHILPHYPSPDCDGGYDITDHTGVRPELGTGADFRALCSAAHERGLRVMVDLVLNHVSSEHEWFKAARASKQNEKRDWFLWSDTGTEYATAPPMFMDFKGSNWVWNEATQDYYYATYKPCQPDLNWSNPAVMEAMLEVVDTLVDQGVDGFRLDAIMRLVEKEGTTSVGIPETHECIRRIRAYIDQYHPGVILLGEVVGTTEYSRTYFGDSNECHLSYNFELMSEMLYALRMGGRRERLRVAVEAARTVPPQATWMAFLRNHDSVTVSTLGEERAGAWLGAVDPEKDHQFAHGTETVQRLYDLLEQDESLLREAFSMLYALPCATVMYYGDEIGMPNAPLPPGENDMRYTVRAPFDWEQAEMQMQDPASLFHHVRRCIAASKRRTR